MPISRRRFIREVSFAFAAAGVPRYPAPYRLPIAFSTLACPTWEWATVLDFAAAHGFAAIELRGLQGNLDLPSHPVFSKQQIQQTKREIRAHELRIACVSTSAYMNESDATKRAEQLSDAERFIDLAASLNAPYVRVFGTNSDEEGLGVPGDSMRARIANSLNELGEYGGLHKVSVLIESHDHCVTSPVLSDILRRADSPHVGLLWDAHHTFADGKEAPQFTVRQLGKWIRHTHLKDSLPAGSERKYVLTGRGDVPIQRQVAALQKMGYPGFFCFEWEKVWHPDLTDPEIAVADYAQVMAGYLHQAK
jgi:sugar phosphate isomerase/epimerase